jgi:acyl carrier protein
MTATDEMRQKVKEIVCEILEVSPGEVTDTSLFMEEHDADSMRSIEILAALELSFKVTIPQPEIRRMVNLAGIYDVLEDRLAGSAR